MGRTFLMAVLLLAVGWADGEVRAEEFCLQTFNVYGPLYANDKESRFQNIVYELKKQGLCEITQFQEVWTTGQFTDFLRDFSGVVGPIEGVHFDQLRGDGKFSGLANFYLHAPLRVGAELFWIDFSNWFDEMKNWFGVRKGFGFSEYHLAGGERPLLMVNLHLHPFSDAVRVSQLLQVAEWLVDRVGHLPSIVFSGDLNAEPDSLEWRLMTQFLLLKDAFLEVNEEYAPTDCTYCSGNPLSWERDRDRTIDFVFYRSGRDGILQAEDASVNLRDYYGSVLSDHYGLRVYFNYESKAFRNLRIPAARLKAALEVLGEASALMEQTDASKYGYFIDVAQNFVSRLKRQDPQDPLYRYFETADLF